jgi:hypothetical protein
MVTLELAPDPDTPITTPLPASGTPGTPTYYPGGTYVEPEPQRQIRSVGSKKFPFALAQGIITNENKTFKSVNASGVITYIQKGNAIKAFRGMQNGLQFNLTSASSITFNAGAYYVIDANVSTTYPSINADEYWVIRETNAFTLDITGNVADTWYVIMGNKDGVITVASLASINTGGNTSNFANGTTSAVFGYHTYFGGVSYRILGLFLRRATLADSSEIIFVNQKDYYPKVNARYSKGTWSCPAPGGTVIWDSRGTDSHNAMNTTTGVFTIPPGGAGLYQANASAFIFLGTGITGYDCAITINGTNPYIVIANYFSSITAAHYYSGYTCAGCCYLTEGAQVAVTINQNTGAARNVGASYFSIVQIASY